MTREEAIDIGYKDIQELKRKGHTFNDFPVYDVKKSDLEKLMNITDKYGMPFGWLFNLIRHESAGTFNPAVRNKSTGATGLIQFMPKINGVKMTYAKADGSAPVGTEQLKKMTFSEQLDYVDGYIKRGFKKYLDKNGKLKDDFSQLHLFMTIFYPASVGKPDYVFPANVQAQNGGIRTPRDYEKRTLSKAAFPISILPSSLSDVKKKFGETLYSVSEAVKRNIVPILIVSALVGGIAYYYLSSKKILI